MKKIPKDIKLQIDKGNFVIAIKELSKQDNISFNEAKARIDAYEAEVKAKKEGVTSSENNINNLVSSSEDTIDNMKKAPLPLAWVRLAVIVLVIVLLACLSSYFI